MTTTLTSVSTFGWYEDTVTDRLTPVSTFGWYLGDLIVGTPEIITFILCLNTIMNYNLER